MTRRLQSSTRTDTLFPYTTLCRSDRLSGRLVDLAKGYRRARPCGGIDFNRNGDQRQTNLALPIGTCGHDPLHHRCYLDLITGGPSRSITTREARGHRSEEHTSELQSLMRISYAVFCLKKKNTYVQKNTYDNKRKLQRKEQTK